MSYVTLHRHLSLIVVTAVCFSVFSLLLFVSMFCFLSLSVRDQKRSFAAVQVDIRILLYSRRSGRLFQILQDKNRKNSESIYVCMAKATFLVAVGQY